MMRRRWRIAALAAAITAVPVHAEAAGAWMAAGSTSPVEQRVAVAAGPARTTLWTSLRFASAGGPLAIVLPAPPGAAIDFSSDAWLEALDVATTPRVVPPSSLDPRCPGASGTPYPFEVEGTLFHTASLAPADVAVLDGAGAVAAWAAQAGLVLAPAAQDGLAALGDTRFVALRFDAPAGSAVTPTVRVVMPGAAPLLPLALTRAGSEDLRVTAFVLGPGRADLPGAAEVSVANVTWQAKAAASDYEARRDDALAADPTRFLVEAAGTGPLAQATPIVPGAAPIDAVVTTFFDRAAAYGDGDFDGAACAAVAAAALASTAPVAASCPRAAIASIDPAAACAESPGPAETDPARLRCGAGADDLAVALSGLAPAGVWLTRLDLAIGAGEDGVTFPIAFTPGPSASPVVAATTLDASDCDAAGSSTDVPLLDPPDGDPTPYGSSPSNAGASADPGTSSSSSGGSSSGGSCHCDGEAVGAGAEGCAAGLEACAEIAGGLGDAADDCSISDVRRVRNVRFSSVLMALLAVLAPLRRRLRPARSTSSRGRTA